MNPLNVVCVGAGYFARYHVEAWKRIPDVHIVGICDEDLQKAQKLAAEFDVEKTYNSIDKVYDDVDFDILDIITPPSSHYALCTQAADRGKHIVCQKPLTPDFDKSQELVQRMNDSNVRFMVHENFRFQPWYRKIRSLIEEKAIGDDIFSISHRMRTGDGWSERAYLDRQPYFREMPRLLVYETAIHFIDVFRFLAGDIISVFAKLRRLNRDIKGEDCGLILFDFENGCQGVFDGNRYNESPSSNPRYTFGEMLIEGSGGSIRLHSDGSIFQKKLGAEEVEIEYWHDDVNFASDCVYFTQEHFIECLRYGRDFETNGNEYLRNLQVQEAVYVSAREGIVVEP